MAIGKSIRYFRLQREKKKLQKKVDYWTRKTKPYTTKLSFWTRKLNSVKAKIRNLNKQCLINNKCKMEFNVDLKSDKFLGGMNVHHVIMIGLLVYIAFYKK